MSLRDCRGRQAKHGEGFSLPCVLDPGNPCRDDGLDILSTPNANIANQSTINHFNLTIMKQLPRPGRRNLNVLACGVIE
jgi:hypothetical protein